jgi:hypothetical protein
VEISLRGFIVGLRSQMQLRQVGSTLGHGKKSTGLIVALSCGPATPHAWAARRVTSIKISHRARVHRCYLVTDVACTDCVCVHAALPLVGFMQYILRPQRACLVEEL